MSNEKTVIDIGEALKRAMGDADFLRVMLEELHRSIPGFVSRIENALNSNDTESLGSDAHQFKGAAANLGAKALAHAALQLEKIGKSGALEGAAEAFDHLEQSIADFNHNFQAIDWSAVSAE